MRSSVLKKEGSMCNDEKWCFRRKWLKKLRDSDSRDRYKLLCDIGLDINEVESSTGHLKPLEEVASIIVQAGHMLPGEDHDIVIDRVVMFVFMFLFYVCTCVYVFLIV